MPETIGPGPEAGDVRIDQILEAEDETALLRLQTLLFHGDTRREDQIAKWQIGTAVVTGIAVILSSVGVFVAWLGIRGQVQTAAIQDQATRYGSISELSLEVDRMIAESPEVASCFREDACRSDMSELDAVRAENMAIYIVDYYQYLFQQLVNLGYAPRDVRLVRRADPAAAHSTEDWITWSETIAIGFESSELLCEALNQARDAYSREFTSAIDSANVCHA